MTVPLYMDEHVQWKITEGLRARSVDVLTVQEDDRSGVPDQELLDRATELGRLFFTRDTDLLQEGALRQASGLEFAGVVYAHPIRVSVGDVIRDLELIALASEPVEFQNVVTYLPLR